MAVFQTFQNKLNYLENACHLFVDQIVYKCQCGRQILTTLEQRRKLSQGSRHSRSILPLIPLVHQLEKGQGPWALRVHGQTLPLLPATCHQFSFFVISFFLRVNFTLNNMHLNTFLCFHIIEEVTCIQDRHPRLRLSSGHPLAALAA